DEFAQRRYLAVKRRSDVQFLARLASFYLYSRKPRRKIAAIPDSILLENAGNLHSFFCAHVI
ncbi:hypothetical protein ABTK14_24290, partial [Acinetobacter baumannii]